MKRAAMVIALMSMCAWAFAQDKPATQAAAGQTAGQTTAAPQGKRPPAFKSTQESDAFKSVLALPDAAATEKAADDFASKYPDSEVRVMLYKNAMQKYQQANNADKMLEMGQKALAIDPDDPEALVGVAQVLAERTRDTDLDKDQKLAESKKDAERALVTVDTDVPTSGYPPEKLAQYKGFIRSEAYAVLGTLATNAKDWPEAETTLKKSIDAFPEVDPIAVLRLAIALDHENKVPEALKYANQAVDLTKDRPDSAGGKAARAEQDRLTKLNSGTAPGQTTTPAKQ
jgi:tetratricopeptide (TPR) repeat protein